MSDALAQAIGRLSGELHDHILKEGGTLKTLGDEVHVLFELVPELAREIPAIMARLNEHERRIRRGENVADDHGKRIALLEAARRLPAPPRSPSVPDFESEEITLHGKPIAVVGGNVTLPKSDFAALKVMIRVARDSWSIAQKSIVTVLATVILGMGAILIAFMWREGRAIVVPGPPVLVITDAGGEAQAK